MATVRNPPPRMLSANETIYSLGHWITGFRTYYRRDSYYKGFLLPLARWDSSAEYYGQHDDTRDGRVIRTALDKSEDLKDFAKQRPKAKQSQAIWPCLVLFSIESSHPAGPAGRPGRPGKYATFQHSFHIIKYSFPIIKYSFSFIFQFWIEIIFSILNKNFSILNRNFSRMEIFQFWIEIFQEWKFFNSE